MLIFVTIVKKICSILLKGRKRVFKRSNYIVIHTHPAKEGEEGGLGPLGGGAGEGVQKRGFNLLCEFSMKRRKIEHEAQPKKAMI